MRHCGRVGRDSPGSPALIARCRRTDGPALYRRGKGGRVPRLGYIIIHPGRQTPFALTFNGIRRHRNDGEMLSCRNLARTNGCRGRKTVCAPSKAAVMLGSTISWTPATKKGVVTARARTRTSHKDAFDSQAWRLDRRGGCQPQYAVLLSELREKNVRMTQTVSPSRSARAKVVICSAGNDH